MAVAWLEADLDALYRLAHMKDVVTRKPEVAALHAQITALEDRLGLTPLARRKLQWEISQAEEAEDEEEETLAPVRNLRAVK